MDFQHISLLLSVIHASQEVDPWFGQEARKELMKIKAEHTKPAEPTFAQAPVELPKAMPTPIEPREIRRA